jgi:hypothetical protein
VSDIAPKVTATGSCSWHQGQGAANGHGSTRRNAYQGEGALKGARVGEDLPIGQKLMGGLHEEQTVTGKPARQGRGGPCYQSYGAGAPPRTLPPEPPARCRP